MIEYEDLYARLGAQFRPPSIEDRIADQQWAQSVPAAEVRRVKPHPEPSVEDWDDPVSPYGDTVTRKLRITPLADYPVRFVAIGIPGPQGSKVSKGPGVMVESSKKVKPWRERVAWTFRELYPNFVPLDGPLVARMIFTLRQPASVPASRVDAVDRTPDVSKLARSTEDALTGLAWVDDARILGYDRLWKTYPGRDAEALDTTGAVIAVRRATHAEIGLEPDSKAGLRYTALIEKWEQR